MKLFHAPTIVTSASAAAQQAGETAVVWHLAFVNKPYSLVRVLRVIDAHRIEVRPLYFWERFAWIVMFTLGRATKAAIAALGESEPRAWR